MGIIDIHTHIIPNVDDGSPNLETSIFLIKEEIKQGITHIICTPHYRIGMFESTKEEITVNFNLLKEEIKKQDLNISLYLGQEIYLKDFVSLKEMLNKNLVFSINEKKYLLLEFSYTRNTDISEIVYVSKLKGYTPIIAHVERYGYVNIEDVKDIIEAGGLIQVNAESIIGKNGHRIKKMTQKLIKNNLIHFIASDIHHNRINYINQAYDLIYKKYGEEIANNLFYNNAKKIIDGGNDE